MKDTYYTRSVAKRVERKKQVRKNIFLLTLSITFILILAAFLITSFSTQASDHQHQPSYKYYKSIMISDGDTLWSIAAQNMDSHYEHAADYVAEVKRMNSLETDRIIAGNYLIIPYYSTEFISSQD